MAALHLSQQDTYAVASINEVGHNQGLADDAALSRLRKESFVFGLRLESIMA